MDNNYFYNLCDLINITALGIVYVFTGIISSSSSSFFITNRDCFVIDATNLISSLRSLSRSFSVIFGSMVIKVYSVLLSAVKEKI